MTSPPTLSTRIADAAAFLEQERLDDAGTLAEDAIEELTRGCGAEWQELPTTRLLPRLGAPERARALARALWVASAVDEAHGRADRAGARCRRAMEIYGRLRLVSEELDVRAARELGSASARLGATRR